jgi:hypothetical protein
MKEQEIGFNFQMEIEEPFSANYKAHRNLIAEVLSRAIRDVLSPGIPKEVKRSAIAWLCLKRAIPLKADPFSFRWI